MDKDLFDGLAAFLAVARHSGFTPAAEALQVSPTAMSKAIRVLEARHGVRLFRRTTRRVALTEAGEELFRRLQGPASEIEDALAALGSFQQQPRGTLRLTVPRSAMPGIVEPLLADYARLHPEVKLHVGVNDGFDDLIAGGFDAGVRLGEAIARDMVAVRLTPEVRWAIAGSPAYLDRAGLPREPEELAGHRAVLYRFPGSRAVHVWEFVRDGRAFQVRMDDRLVVDDRAAVVRLAARGLGLAFVQEAEAAREVAAGALRLMFGEYIPADDGMFLYFPAAMQSQPKLRALIDLAARARRRMESRRVD